MRSTEQEILDGADLIGAEAVRHMDGGAAEDAQQADGGEF